MKYNLALTTLLLTQLFPTFATYLQTAGNGIPYYISIIGFGLALFFYLSESIPNKIFTTLTVFYTLAISYVLFVTMVSPLPIGIRDISIVLKFMTMYLAFICGYLYYREFRSFKPFFHAIGVAFGLNLVLYVLHLIKPFNEIQMMYFFTDVHNERFPGTWNHPYNTSVFFYAVFVYFLYKVLNIKNAQDKTFYILLCLLAMYLCIFATQSRSTFIAFWGAGVVSAVLLGWYAMTRNSGRLFASSVGLLITIGALVYAFVQYLYIALDQGLYGHLTKLVDPQQEIPVSRFDQISTYFNDYLSEQPLYLFIGFGPARSVDFNIESYMNYVFQFGIIGSFLFVLGIWFVTLRKCIILAFDPRSISPSAYLLGATCIIFIMFMGMSTNILTHFRFVPMAHFLLGMFFAHAHYDYSALKLRYLRNIKVSDALST